MTCEYWIGLLGSMAGTAFWLCYLTWEMQYYKGEKKKGWWNIDIGFWLANKIRDWRNK